MVIGDIIRRYREEHGLSQRQFASKCGDITNGYISMIEQGRNPSTGKPVVPSIDKLSSLAKGMDITLQQLMEQADDMPVFIGDADKYDADIMNELEEEPKPRKWKMLSAGVLTLTDEQLDKLYDMAHVLYPDKFPERKEDD